MNPFKEGDKVRYKDGDTGLYTVHTVYSASEVSLGLRDSPEIEQDWQTNINEIEIA